jgi:hypothetical protein
MGRKRALQQGDRVRLDAHLADPADESGPSMNLHQERCRVIGTNPVYQDSSTGEERVSLELEETGGIISAPTQALRRVGDRRSTAFRMDDRKYRRIFGHAPRVPFPSPS